MLERPEDSVLGAFCVNYYAGSVQLYLVLPAFLLVTEGFFRLSPASAAKKSFLDNDGDKADDEQCKYDPQNFPQH